jgi:flavin-dependent dehydrogenase
VSGPPFDERVVIVGGGTAGAATALALQRAGVPTVLIERSARPAWKVGEALPPAANPLVRRLGLWGRLQDEGHLPSYGNASAWGSPALVDHSFLLDPNGSGWHLDRPRFDALLLQAAREHGARFVLGTAALHQRPASGERSFSDERSAGDGCWLRVTPDEGDSTLVRAPFAVDASGRAAVLARDSGARREHLDRLVGIVGLLATRAAGGGPDTRTMVEAVEDGWWYSALVPGGRLVVAFMTDGDIARRRAAHTLAGWSSLLGETVHTCARVVAHEARLLATPRVVLANSSRPAAVVGRGWLAVGDAAIAHDPLSSQGIASALLLGLSAADAIRDALGGRAADLTRYRELVERLSAEYLGHLAYYYGQEARWPRAPFWSRRRERGARRAAPGR